MAHKFKNYKNAIFIDIGCGMSGKNNENRPSIFWFWTNYRIKNYNYTKIDPTNFDSSKDNVKYL